MRPVFAVLLVTVMVVGCASLYLTKGLRTEAGRKRLFPLLRPLMRVINPRVVRAIERRQSSFGLVHHIGRRSGITYRTPVDVAGSSVGVLISLPYGPETNWCRNVLAAGECTITVDGEELALTQPEVLLKGEVQAMLPACHSVAIGSNELSVRRARGCNDQFVARVQGAVPVTKSTAEPVVCPGRAVVTRERHELRSTCRDLLDGRHDILFAQWFPRQIGVTEGPLDQQGCPEGMHRQM
jgi:deazaflavin-dependent oxidoreductase (nitroreductase family)